MRWEEGRRSENVEDRRSAAPRQLAVGGGLGTILLVILAMLFGADPRALIQKVQMQQQQAGPAGQAPADPAEDKEADFVRVVLADTEDVWNDLLPKVGRRYEDPKLVLFRGQVSSACGMASSAVGPFYCPGDHMVYLDLDFFKELDQRFGAEGDFAQAYVVAHEVGHHVQNLLGYTAKLDRLRPQLSEVENNRLSVRLELQADFLAGVWAHHAHKNRNILEQGDVEEALRAANAIGDDRLQRQAQGYVVPDSFTHGTSEQRIKWFRKGLVSGKIEDGDTFSLKDSEL